MEKTTTEIIKFIKEWISKNGATENLERLLYRIEHENVIQVDLIPEEIFHHFHGSNVSPLLMDMVPKIQKVRPEYDADALAKRGAAICGAKDSTEEVPA